MRPKDDTPTATAMDTEMSQIFVRIVKEAESYLGRLYSAA
jgi:hypothetical protein